jgi:hypothetical protein
MADRLNPQMIKDAFDLYLKYNGQRFDLIDAEMAKLGWAGFKSNSRLKNRGKGDNFRAGWIETFGWAKSLEVRIATAGTAAQTSAESLLFEVEVIRKKIFMELETRGVGLGSKDLIYQHDKYISRSTEILDKLNDARDNYANIVFFLQWLTKRAPAIYMPLAQALSDCEDALLDHAEKDFVKEPDGSDE